MEGSEGGDGGDLDARRSTVDGSSGAWCEETPPQTQTQIQTYRYKRRHRRRRRRCLEPGMKRSDILEEEYDATGAGLMSYSYRDMALFYSQ